MAKLQNLELGVIGNCGIAALIDREASVQWCCLPRFDGDPVFCALVDGADPGRVDGQWSIVLEGSERGEQVYEHNTAVLVTRLFASDGSAIEIVDFCPRFEARGRMFRPQMLVRRVRRLAGRPRIRVRLRPRFGYGAVGPVITHGSNHVRYQGPAFTLRLTTDAPVTYVLDETAFLVDEPLNFLLGPDETIEEGLDHLARHFHESTARYWQQWTRRLALPLEWQQAVIRAAITLKLSTYEDTGAIVAAMTTSIPEAPGTQRNWDYRYCWLRDAFFVVRALNSLSAVEAMELYLRYFENLVVDAPDGHLQPVYGIGLERALTERHAECLGGYRGMGPVRIGNQAYEHFQHDVYGNVILAATQSFFDERLMRTAGHEEFARLESVGDQAFRVHALSDAGMWELRTRARVHTSSTLMCWAACDRLGKIALHLGLTERAVHWQQRAEIIRAAIDTHAWNAEANSYVESFGGADVEAGLLLMVEVGFVAAQDPRFLGTLAAVENRLRRGPYLFRYAQADDFGMPETAFNICTFWYLDALAKVGRRDEARELFENMLARRNHLGLLSEDVHPQTGELWGNYPQTYSLVGIINAATRLSRDWEDAV
ncbi:GH15 family glucan-1,4-alpha-glucosidase [Panacagrimonas perspica]|uniref:GH15 family glucan-1,4-alpha-glucosidase n=1 Tax=Panacagrimonas perspica TaxID=381431 RepID=A0A4R7NWJ6_9GAMM|nr:glycoside hydrolase family 15 protein [Panacagrimonas perspica]TDU25593.1 GH15 family glucan-1,4-alpha-glucosidase [Panacagrimonas perspica]THD03809.1 glucoamylase [Panacagrimonas perspica]